MKREPINLMQFVPYERLQNYIRQKRLPTDIKPEAPPKTIKSSDIPKRPRLFEVKDGGGIVLNLHEGQRRALSSDARYVIVIAGSQSGKTSIGPWWVYNEIKRLAKLNKENDIYGVGDILIVAATYDMFKLKVLPEVQAVFDRTLNLVEWRAQDRQFIIKDPDTGIADKDNPWGRLILRSADVPKALESATAVAIWMDEAGVYPLEAWDAIQRRITTTRGRVFMTTTPYDWGWLKQQIYDPWSNGKAPEYEIINFPSIMNPNFDRAEFEARRNTMPAWKFDMFYRGLFTRPAGLIYEDFVDRGYNDGGHKLEPIIPSSDWQRIIGIDPGSPNLGEIWMAQNPSSGVWVVYDERMPGNTSVREHASMIKQKLSLEGDPRYIVAVGQRSERQIRQDYIVNGLKKVKEPPFHEVESGIDRVVEMLKSRRLLITDNCTYLIDQIGSYSRKVDENGQPTSKIDDKGTFHLLDALRYAVIQAFEKEKVGRMPIMMKGVVKWNQKASR